jgi:polyphosphate kinase
MIDVEKSTGLRNKEKPRRTLNEIQEKVLRLNEKFEKTYSVLIKELAKHNIFIINEKQLNSEQSRHVRNFFQEYVQPVITPVMLRNVKQFPHLKDKSIYLAIRMSKVNPASESQLAVIEIPADDISRFIVLPSKHKKKYIILLDDVIRFCLDDIFITFKFDRYEAYTIKLTRDAELDIDNDLSKSFLEKVTESVSDRVKGQPVRFVYDSSMSEELLKYLIRSLQLNEDDNLIAAGRYHNFKDYMKFPNLGGKKLVYKPTPPLSHPLIRQIISKLDVIERKDILLHVPYQKFDHYINLLREASIDPEVLSIKITLYRVAYNSRVIGALINAALNGKKVTVVIELQARFDEKTNIYWSRKLEEAGAQVIFGMRGLKVHSKLLLIERNQKNRVVKYASVGTGNYNEGTALVYADLHLLTADKRITEEVDKVFKFFETTYKTYTFRHLLVSPLHMRKRLYKMIDNEIRNAKSGKDAYIILKINSLVDNDMIEKLYEASRAGVRIKAIIRGMCSLIPGIPGMSDNIRVISIVDKFLEHSRVFVFCNNHKELYYIASADWMPRNLDNRIEIAAPIYDPDIQQEIKTMLNIQLKDNVKARIIDASGNNPYKKPSNSRKIRSQMELYRYYHKLCTASHN